LVFLIASDATADDQARRSAANAAKRAEIQFATIARKASAFGGKADIAQAARNVPLLTQSGY
jgi:hypothetical protein